jgi:hypothetical protein
MAQQQETLNDILYLSPPPSFSSERRLANVLVSLQPNQMHAKSEKEQRFFTREMISARNL